MRPATDPPRSGLLFLVTAPSGAGKDSVIGLLRERGMNMAVAITALTRAPRAGERDRVDHFFLCDAEFETRLADGWFLETARVYGRRYGTPIHQVREPLLAGIHLADPWQLSLEATFPALRAAPRRGHAAAGAPSPSGARSGTRSILSM